MPFAAWQAATTCTGQAGPGARALMKALLELHPKGKSLGIYNCRTVRGGSTTSAHGEGRALDVGFPMTGGRGSAEGHALVKQLIKHAEALGVSVVIYDRRIWSAKSPDGRPYGGVAPHYDHVHVELTREAAAELTPAKVRAILAPPPPAKPKPTKPGGLAEHKPGSRVLNNGDRGTDVALLQRFLGITDDGIFGPRTEAAVRKYQRMRGLEADGIAGPKTWAPILRAVKGA